MKLVLLIGYLLLSGVRFGLEYLNLHHRQQADKRLPESFAGHIDEERLQQSEAYALAGDKLGFVEDLVGIVLTVVFLFAGLLPWYDTLVGRLELGFIAQGLVFFGVLALVQLILSLPFSLYRNFVLEEKFGFNRMSLGLWGADLLKSLLIGGVLFIVLASGALWLIERTPGSWWLWVWAFWAIVSLFLLFLSPYLIEPLFFKFSPLEREDLEQDVRQLLDRAGVTVGKVLQVDASRRSGHSNAYFTGIGKVKRVVLFDTLMDQLEKQELLAVLAHELGHWRCGHLRQMLIKSQMMALFCCWAAFVLLRSQLVPGWLGLYDLSFFAQLLVLGWVASLVGYLWSPVSSWWSRRQEREADQFAVNLVGSGRPLASGLVKLARENLSNLFPHPLYTAFYYSHPPLVERVVGLENRVADKTEANVA